MVEQKGKIKRKKAINNKKMEEPEGKNQEC